MYKPLMDLVHDLKPYLEEPTKYVYTWELGTLTIFKVSEVEEIKT